MAGQSLVYSNARVKAMENSLLSGEKITRMAYADSLAEAVKVLYESNYGGGYMVDNPYCFAEVLRAEEEIVTAFMREAMPDKSGLESLLSPLDYHNAKAYYKIKAAGITDTDKLIAPDGNIPREQIEEGILSGNADSLPKEMAEAVRRLDSMAQNGELTPRKIDVEIDKALYRDITAQTARVKAKSIRKYWHSNIDFINISTLLRCRRIGADIEFFRENFINGGDINNYVLEGLFNESLDVIADRLRYTGYTALIDLAVADIKADRALVKFETAWDNYLLDIFREDRADIFTVAPIAGFYVAKKIELKTVRMILTAIRNNADESSIKERLRGLYA